MEMGFKWDFAYEILPQMLWATLNTIIAAGVGYAIALVVGLLFYGKICARPIFRWLEVLAARKVGR